MAEQQQPQGSDGAPRRTLLWRFNRFLEKYLPDRLYPRSLIIVIAPVVVLQAIMLFLVVERHWDRVTKSLSRAIAREVTFVTELYEASSKTAEAVKQLTDIANRSLDMTISVEKASELPAAAARPLFAFADAKLTRYLSQRLKKPIAVNTLGQTGLIDIRIRLDESLVLHLLVNEGRATATSTHIFVFWLLGSSMVLLAVAIVFLRKQIEPILDLTAAAQSFGLGREVQDFRPRGAAEVRAAALAFVDMKNRIERHVEQRTAMLAGVSHDLRTILTRFKLQLALLGKSAKASALRRDVDEMQRMLEGYMAFARGDAGEKSTDSDLGAMLRLVARDAKRSGNPVEVDVPDDLAAAVKPDAFQRCIANLVANAARYGGRVRLSAERTNGELIVRIDDNGPGIPPDKREDVFKPFVRLDDARNLDESGTGLGLSIARDIARAHGGDVMLSDSPLGGVRAQVKIPA
jgi:two-component system osmolarity sensor histidine kinase EnvZ